MNKKRYPVVRFNNNDWYKSQLKFNLIKNTNKNNNLEVTYVESISNKYGFISQKEQFKGYSVASKNLSNYYIIKQNYFAYNPSRINIGSIAFKYPGDKISIVSPLYVSFKVKEDVLNSLFLLNWFQTQYFKKQRMILSEGSVRDSLSFNQLEQIYIYKPDIYTQEIIGIFFKNFNNITQYYSNKIKNLYMIKNALLQNLFINYDSKYPKIRFKEFSDAWERRRLKDTLSSLKSGLSRKLSDKDIGIPVIRANNIKNGNLIINKNMKYWYEIDPQGANINMYTVKKNDILINFINSDNQIGTSAIVVKDLNRRTIYTTNILKAAVNKHTDPYFWFSLINTEKYYADIATITKPAINQSSFTTKDFKKLTYYFPKLEEQKKIGVTIKQINDLISLYERKLELLELMKKGFLQKMFV